MISSDRMTAEQFIHVRSELPDGGRWHELHEGRAVLMEAPDDAHGTTVLNLSRALAEWFKQADDQDIGYACPQIALHVAQDPDTLLCPAMSYFCEGRQFEEADNAIAVQVPRLVIDVASANDRRSEMRTRTLAYAQLGVQTIWIPDPMKKEVQVIHANADTLALGTWQNLDGGSALPGFSIKVEEIFKQPEWWK